MTTEGRSFTGQMRDRRTRRSVQLADVLSRLFITAGGIGTIIAVTGVAVFLIAVVVPLFQSAEVHAREGADVLQATAPSAEKGTVAAFGVDEYGVLGWVLWSSGSLDVFRLDTGEVRRSVELYDPGRMTAVSVPLLGDLLAFGLDDGTVELSQIGFRTEYLEDDWVPEEVRARLAELEPMSPVDHDDGVLQRTLQGQYRYQALEVSAVRSRQVADGPIRLLDHVSTSAGPRILALAATPEGGARRLLAVQCEEKDDFFTGGKTFDFSEPVELPLESDRGVPEFLAMSGTGRDFYLVWKDGEFLRLRTALQLEDTFAAEHGSLIESGELAFVEFVLGENTLMWGDEAGNVRAGFLVRISDLEQGSRLLAEPSSDRSEYGTVLAKEMPTGGGHPTSMEVSRRNRVVAAGFADGAIELYNVTNEARLARFQVPGGEPVLRMCIAPKEDALVAVTQSGAHVLELDLKHPEAELSSLFGRIWYEGYGGPAHTWQSSSGHTGFEPKLGLVPLVVGTLKATFYSMLFGAPLAVLAAIFSSEFLSSRTKSVIKPTIELMASLPSVVLGFLAAQVIAPFVGSVLSATLAMLLCIPLAFVGAAYLWQLLPSDRAVRLGRFRFAFFAPALAVGVLLGTLVGPVLESALFQGDFEGWLAWDGRPGSERFASPFGGWALLLLPLSGVGVALAANRLLGPRLRRQATFRSRAEMARLDLLRFVGTAGAVVLVCGLLAGGLSAAGFDPRGSLTVWGIDLSPMGTYVQRNSLIVGFVMGFAIIPIIYTIADDALSSVPNHLRSASLGAGATTWQTAVRIVLPTAMSGIFSALMIGLGRAVGETMIVLMATGNTPILELNVFNGFRTLAANIAYELPEAVRDSTHYRTLFLAALVLFVMTFAVNTVAESVRLRFRKRAYQL